MSLRARLKRLRADLTWRTEETWFYNLDNYRPAHQVKRELTAIATTHEPAVLAVVECIGNEIPELDGYRLVRDPSTRSRENISVYLRTDLPLGGERWLDLNGTWPRTEGPGIHEARSYLLLTIGRMQHAVAHQPPQNADHHWTLQVEGIVALTSALAPWKSKDWRAARERLARLRPRLLVWDANRRSGEPGPGPDTLARKIRGTVHGGERIDSAVTRGRIEVLAVSKHASVAGVHLESDHLGAVRFRWRVRAWWLRPAPPHRPLLEQSLTNRRSIPLP